MAGIRKVFIDESDFYSLTVGVNASQIALNVFPYMAVHDGTISGTQHVFLQGVELVEVAYADIDVLANVGKYAVSATNSIIFIVDSATVDTEAKAKNYISGLLLKYQMVNLEYSGTSAVYTMETRSSDGTLIGTTLASSLTDLSTKMIALDDDQNVNGAMGYYSHVLTRSLVAS